MLRGTLLVLVISIASIVVGCSSDVGNDGASVGGSCEVSVECTPDSVCRTGTRFPGGYCALSCDTNDDCPGGSVCTQEEGGICMVSCTTDGECRSAEGYACVAVEARGAAGTVNVCGTAD